MKILSNKEEEIAKKFMDKAAKVAIKATCKRDKCGAVIVSVNEILGKGFNSPPGNLESQRRCDKKKNFFNKKVTDKTCCIHAEQRAIMDALRKNPSKLKGATLYFMRLGEKGCKTFAGKPYCTICSKMALDVGIREFVLWKKEGICVYDTEEYNNVSFNYR